MPDIQPDTLASLMLQTPDLIAERLAELRRLFPDLFDGEGKLKPDELRQLAGEAVHNREHYEFTWNGKRHAKANAYRSTTATLTYDETRSVNPEKSGGNLIIEGENLESLKCLLAAYRESVKCIYIDPPYNTGNDFVYSDDYSESRKAYWEDSGQMENGVKLDTNPETAGRYHSNWLSMMYPRLLLARQLLRDDGVIFVSIDDHEVHNLRRLLNDVFGEDNSLTQKAGTALIWNKQHSQQQGLFKRYHEYILVIAKNVLALDHIRGGEGTIDAGALKKISKENPASEFTFPIGTRFDAPNGTVIEGTYGDSEKVTVIKGRMAAIDGRTTEVVTLSAGWTQKNQMTSWFSGKETVDTKGQRIIDFYFNSTGKLKCTKGRETITPPTTLPLYGMASESTDALTEIMGAPIFDNPKPVQMIKDFVSWFVNDDEIVLDFFAGAGTTAQAVIELNAQDDGNRKFILVQIPEQTPDNSEARRAGYKKISDITIERVKRVIQGYGDHPQPLDSGFKVFRLTTSHFPRADFAPDPDKSEAENVTALKTYIAEKEKQLTGLFTPADIIDEVLLKNQFKLHYTLTDAPEFAANKVWRADDGERSTLLCLDQKLQPETVGALLKTPQAFICLERALDTADKWNLRNHLGHLFTAF